MVRANTSRNSSEIRVLIVDDSLVFRKFLQDLLSECEDIVIVGEAKNGIEALDMVLKTTPSVILLDLEMPLMDGMTALQHLMIHRPTPTIMFSSLTEQGTARSFDTLKNGAVDFFCKDFIFHETRLQTNRRLLVDKVKNAARVTLTAKEPFFPEEMTKDTPSQDEQQLIFCEECGSRVTISKRLAEQLQNITCSKCGDSIDLHLYRYSPYRPVTFVTVLGGGDGSFFNLLEIIPHLEPQMGGALLVVLHQSGDHVNGFAEYLNSMSAMNVVRAQDGSRIEAGNCYVLPGSEHMTVKPCSNQFILKKLHRKNPREGALDTLLASVSSIFKKRAAGVILSGDEQDGDVGMAMLIKNQGRGLLLDSAECYCKKQSRNVLKKCSLSKTYSTEQLVKQIKTMHYQARNIIKA
ncbi:MAG: chemotaxis protein CheB [Desulforhopalus sp.]